MLSSEVKMANNSYANVWDALLDSPDEAENMRIRSDLMIECSTMIQSWGLSQKEAAEKLEISQPRLSYLLNGKIDKFSIDILVKLLTKSGARIAINVSFPNAQEGFS